MKADQTFVAMAKALDPELRTVLSLIPQNQIISNLAGVPENVVDFLAIYHFNTPYYDLTLPLDAKRRLVEYSILNYLPFGTASAVRGLLAIAFNYAEVIEWWQDTPPAEANTFRVQIADSLVDPARVANMYRLMMKVKNVRSYFAGFSAFTSATTTQKIAVGVATYKYQVIR